MKRIPTKYVGIGSARVRVPNGIGHEMHELNECIIDEDLRRNIWYHIVL